MDTPKYTPDNVRLSKILVSTSYGKATFAKKLYLIAANELSLSQLIMDAETYLILSSGRLLLGLAQTIFQQFCAAGENQQFAVVERE